MLLRIFSELDRLKELVKLLHERGQIPTDVYLLAELRAERSELQRHMATRYGVVTRSDTETLARLDAQIAKLECGAVT